MEVEIFYHGMGEYPKKYIKRFVGTKEELNYLIEKGFVDLYKEV